MQIANCRVVLNREGTDVFRGMITPAEAQLLRYQFEPQAGGNPITHLEILDGEAAVIVKRDDEDPNNIAKAKKRKRGNNDEIRRLMGKYENKVIDKLFPGMNPTLPETFEEAGFSEKLAWQVPDQAGGKTQVQRLKGPASDEDFVFMDVPEGFDTSTLTRA